MRKIGNIVIIIFLLTILLNTISFAQGEIRVIVNKENIKKDDEISLKVEINETNVAVFTLEIYFDEEKLEYVRGPEKSNYSNHRILYMWLSDSGKNEQSIETEEFIFKGVQDGLANIVVLGEFYDENGQSVNVDSGNTLLKIGEQEQEANIKQVDEIEKENNQNVEQNNTSLNALRLDHEGISPDFNKNIKEYYFIADTTIDTLNVTAIPENKNATVTVTGNKNLRIGKNTIEIHILSEDKTKEEIYKIYVTKTQNIELANANLENLAIRQGYLNPSFEPNITKYNMEIENEIKNIDILAIAQNEKAQVTIEGNNEMEIGDNIVKINVLAEDKITDKRYEIIVHRRDEQEQKQYEEEKQVQVERLTAILEESKRGEITNSQIEKQKSNVIGIIIVVILGSIIVTFTIYILKKKKKI